LKFKNFKDIRNTMIRKTVITRSGIAALLLTASVSFAQDIHFSQFDMQPLVVNPALTGMYYGKARANTIYRSQWASVTVPYVTFGASVDMPIYSNDNGDYLAGGLQMFKDQAGDGNLSNFTGMASIAYHKTHAGVDEYHGSDIALGFQAGYVQKSIDLSKLYFADEFMNGSYAQASSAEYGLGLGNSTNYFLVNAGVCFSKAASRTFSYSIAVGANNINQPADAVIKKTNSQVGLDMRLTGLVGAVWNVADRMSMRPSFFYQSQSGATEMVYGNEFHYSLTNTNTEVQFTPAVFAGLYFRSSDAAMITLGAEYSNFRVGLAYDYNVSSLNSASNGNGGFEIALRYIAPYSFSRHRYIPCTRF